MENITRDNWSMCPLDYWTAGQSKVDIWVTNAMYGVDQWIVYIELCKQTHLIWHKHSSIITSPTTGTKSVYWDYCDRKEIMSLWYLYMFW